MTKKITRVLALILCMLLVLSSLSLLIFAEDAFVDMGGGGESAETPVSNVSNLSEADIDRIANVVMHEVGGICGPDTYIFITFADGTSETYYGSYILHQIHAQVLLNQMRSPLFPSTLSECIQTYWASYLSEPGYYSSSYSTWARCRQDVTDVLMGWGFTIPSNVYAATCDPYFASWYPGYYLYASVYWNTGWYDGYFYYYAYGG